MSWDWVIRQLQGERAAIPKAGGRLVINMGMNGYMTKPIRTELRELIVELLTEVGELSTQDLHQQVLEAGVELSREALYSVCKKMKVKGQVQMRTVPRPDNFGKGISLWSVK